MICPICGAPTPDGSKFCGVCGNTLQPAETAPVQQPAAPIADNQIPRSQANTQPPETDRPEAPADPFAAGFSTPQAPKQPAETPAEAPAATQPAAAASADQQAASGGNPLRKLLPIGAAVAGLSVLGLGIWGITKLFGGGDDTLVYLSSGKFQICTDIEADAKDDIELSTARSSDKDASMVQFSSDGKYIYYMTKYNSYDNTGTLNRAEYKKYKAGSSKNEKYNTVIASNVSVYFDVLEDGTVLYENADHTLYYFDGKESQQIAKNVYSYDFDDKKRLVYRTGNYDEGFALYAGKLDDPNVKNKISNDVSVVYSTGDPDHFFFTKRDDETYRETLYMAGYDSTPEKIGNLEEFNQTFRDDKTISWYLIDNDQKLSLYDLVTDDYASADEGITRPEMDDYEIPYYRYSSLYTDSDISGYDKLYASCTKSTRFYSSWFSYYSLEYAAENEEDEAKRAVYQTFVDKYKSKEDSDGYFEVTDAVLNDIKTLAAACSDGEDDWKMLCFAKEQSGTTYDYEAYNAAYEKYKGAASRINIREYLKNPENDIAYKSLYSFADGKATLVNDKVLSYQSRGNTLLFNTADQITEHPAIDSFEYYSQVYDLIEFNDKAENYIPAPDGSKCWQLSEKAVEVLAESDDYTNFYYAGSDLYLFSGSNLYLAETDSSTVTGLKLISDDAHYVSIDSKNSTLYFSANSYSSSGTAYCDLCSTKAGETNTLCKDVCQRVQLLEDGTIFAYTDSNSRGYELTVIDPKGNKTILADEISQYVAVDKDKAYYISDGDLYIWNGKEKTRIRTDVTQFWTAESVKESKYLYLYD